MVMQNTAGVPKLTLSNIYTYVFVLLTQALDLEPSLVLNSVGGTFGD